MIGCSPKSSLYFFINLITFVLNMRIFFLIIICFIIPSVTFCQPTFKIDDNTYKTGTITKEFIFDLTYKDSFKIKLIDSSITYTTSDSLINLAFNYPLGSDNVVYKSINILNNRRQLIKSTDYIGTILQKEIINTYDETSHKRISSIEENKKSNSTIKQLFEYSNDKINGDLIVFITSYLNGKIEYYAKDFFDKNMQKYKEIRYNDNKKDVMHTETFIYGENGKLKARSIYFNEFRVTKDFIEPEGNELAKCFKNFPLVLTDKATTNNKNVVLKKFLDSNKNTLLDKDCSGYEYKFRGPSTDIIVKRNKSANSNQVILRIREKGF